MSFGAKALRPSCKSLPQQQERIRAQRHEFPGGRIALLEAPGAAAPGEDQLVAIELPGRQAEAGDRAVAALLHDQFVTVAAARLVREREPAERLVQLPQNLPVAAHFLGAAG